MPEYLSPGVYVEEIPSAIKPIAGVSTSTACFIGLVPPKIEIPFVNPSYDPTDKSDKPAPPYLTRPFPFRELPAEGSAERSAFDTFKAAPDKLKALARPDNPNLPSEATQKDPKQVAEFLQQRSAIALFKGTYPELADGGTALDAFQKNQDALGKLADANKPDHPSEDTRKNPTNLAQFRDLKKKISRFKDQYPDIADVREPILCTTFSDFQRNFGDFSTDGLSVEPGGDLPADKTGMQNQLAHAVFGFFNNGGTRCYVMRVDSVEALRDPLSLTPLEAIDEISLVAAPGIVDPIVQDNIVTHCQNMSDRFAILDAPVLDEATPLTKENIKNVGNTDYGALYFPWIWVFDPVTQMMHPDGNGEILCAPSGHIAGIYSRTDHERGVFKAPANEVLRGALDLDHQVSRNVQDGLNPYGINCIRNVNDNIRVWGARTIGGDANADLKYISVRRTLLYLRKSIDHGTQWVVFEPNDRSLWAKITRNVSAFLTGVWRDGALFGSTPEEAFYVKCDDETNPPDARDNGIVTTEIGVSIVRPAEFVVFRIQQWPGPLAQ